MWQKLFLLAKTIFAIAVFFTEKNVFFTNQQKPANLDTPSQQIL